MNFNCLIIDDEQPARALIRTYVEKIPGLNILGEFKNPMEAISTISSKRVDILFLDIQMPGLTGLEFIRTLRHKPDIILTTAYSEYALEGYELEVTDYLMKPIAFDRFLRAVNKVIQKKQAPSETPPTNTSEHFLIKSDGQTHRIALTDILYIEGLREYVTFVLTDKKIIVLESLRKLETELPQEAFMRVHKSFIVNSHRVDSHSGHDLTIGSKKIPIGASYRDDVLNKLF
ncbi:LytR/AlgR family response regulator transcription factor [Marinoscillum luteum]|jgi:DNA-binding LytR/AlgR family response regulator|uniref:LytR/AlgR family response regulator transcription factor n=1 Tax=Marinoscillum luteum TaxID=861051 RepID=A0ABW7NC25_9BACT